MHTQSSTRDLVALHRLACGSTTLLAALLERFGSATEVLALAPDVLAECQLADLTEILSVASVREARSAARADLDWLAGTGRHLVTMGDANYPQRLAEIHDPPALLFCEGNVELLGSLQVAIVGSRRMTATGRQVARMLASELARGGITVTSGLARGVDAAAHEGALEATGATIAVLGSGCDVIYPPRNASLARRLLQDGGLIISEFPLGTGARDYHFPRRNRIVTGLSIGTVVVEAALKSGSLISARLAMEQGREVFAVPGSILNPLSAGCHQLIRDGARLTESVQDIVEELAGIVDPAFFTSAHGAVPEGPPGELLRLMEGEPVGVDYLAEQSGLAVHEVLALLIELEVDGFVVNQAGGYALTATCAQAMKSASSHQGVSIDRPTLESPG